jgi:hypothetical protein
MYEVPSLWPCGSKFILSFVNRNFIYCPEEVERKDLSDPNRAVLVLSLSDLIVLCLVLHEEKGFRDYVYVVTSRRSPNITLIYWPFIHLII